MVVDGGCFLVKFGVSSRKRGKYGPHGVPAVTVLLSIAFGGSIPPMVTYDRLHRQCRTLENTFDSKLTTYAHLAATIAQPNQDVEATGSSNRWKDLEQELGDLLTEVQFFQFFYNKIYGTYQLEDINEQLSMLASNSDTLSASMLRTIQRHREIFQDSSRELQRTKARYYYLSLNPRMLTPF